MPTYSNQEAKRGEIVQLVEIVPVKQRSKHLRRHTIAQLLRLYSDSTLSHHTNIRCDFRHVPT
jgi:hypothetical protein